MPFFCIIQCLHTEATVHQSASSSNDTDDDTVDKGDSNDTDDSIWDGSGLEDVTVIATKPNTYEDTWGDTGDDSGDSYPPDSDPPPAPPISVDGGGGAGSGSAGLTNAELAELAKLEQDYKGEMSSSGLEIYNSLSSYKKFHYLHNAYQALHIAQDNFPSSLLWNGKGDAFRHALFSAFNTPCLGSGFANQLGDAHEHKPDQNPLETQMDLFNNNVGRNTPQSVTPSDYWLLHVNDGQLRYISSLASNGIVIPGVSEIIPTNQ